MTKTTLSWQEQSLWWLLYSVSWIGSSALAFWLMLELRINLIDINNFFGWGPWILIGLDKFGFLVLGLCWLIGVFVIEIYLRRSESLTMLWRQSLRIFLIVLVTLAISEGLQRLLT